MGRKAGKVLMRLAAGRNPTGNSSRRPSVAPNVVEIPCGDHGRVVVRMLQHLAVQKAAQLKWSARNRPAQVEIEHEHRADVFRRRSSGKWAIRARRHFFSGTVRSRFRHVLQREPAEDRVAVVTPLPQIYVGLGRPVRKPSAITQPVDLRWWLDRARRRRLPATGQDRAGSAQSSRRSAPAGSGGRIPPMPLWML